MASLLNEFGGYQPPLGSVDVPNAATGGGGGTSAGNGAPTASTQGYLYVQWDSVPPGINWWKDASGNWN